MPENNYELILEHIAKALHITPKDVEEGMQFCLEETWRNPKTALGREQIALMGPKVPTPREVEIKMSMPENKEKRSVLIYRAPPKRNNPKKEDAPGT